MSSTLLKSKENKPNYNPGQSPQEMAAEIARLNNVVVQLTSQVNQLLETIVNLKDELSKAVKKNKELEQKLAMVKEFHSDSSN